MHLCIIKTLAQIGLSSSFNHITLLKTNNMKEDQTPYDTNFIAIYNTPTATDVKNSIS